MWSGISIVCFASSYAITLALEISRLFFRSKIRHLTLLGFLTAGLLAHSIYLVTQAHRGLELRGAPLSSWYHWCLIGAWCVAVVYLVFSLSRPGAQAGIFVLPLILGLLGVATMLPKDQFFPAERATEYWGMAHGIALLAGTVAACLGFVTGIMYLVQSYRLKHKWTARPGFRLPSLEWLQTANERSLVFSSLILASGLLAGIVLNLIKHSQQAQPLPWSDPVVCISVALLVWLVLVLIFNALYRPARYGRKVAYLTTVSFFFLLMVLGFVLFSPTRHATGTAWIGPAELTPMTQCGTTRFSLPGRRS
ncbi:MAG: hypothetical protein R3E01_29430 [Pirellulaceae bacterium]|nr:hypothetical protein [Planctomycetales bacterium]